MAFSVTVGAARGGVIVVDAAAVVAVFLLFRGDGENGDLGAAAVAARRRMLWCRLFTPLARSCWVGSADVQQRPSIRAPTTQHAEQSADKVSPLGKAEVHPNHTRTHTYTHTYTHTQTDTHTHTHTHTHTQTCLLYTSDAADE